MYSNNTPNEIRPQREGAQRTTGTGERSVLSANTILAPGVADNPNGINLLAANGGAG